MVAPRNLHAYFWLNVPHLRGPHGQAKFAFGLGRGVVFPTRIISFSHHQHPKIKNCRRKTYQVLEQVRTIHYLSSKERQFLAQDSNPRYTTLFRMCRAFFSHLGLFRHVSRGCLSIRGALFGPASV